MNALVINRARKSYGGVVAVDGLSLEGEGLRERVLAALLFVGLVERAGERVHGYSGGMKRRLNLAAAIVHDPPIVLLDEPTVGVDPQSRGLIFDNRARVEGLALRPGRYWCGMAGARA